MRFYHRNHLLRLYGWLHMQEDLVTATPAVVLEDLSAELCQETFHSQNSCSWIHKDHRVQLLSEQPIQGSNPQAWCYLHHLWPAELISVSSLPSLGKKISILSPLPFRKGYFFTLLSVSANRTRNCTGWTPCLFAFRGCQCSRAGRHGMGERIWMNLLSSKR